MSDSFGLYKFVDGELVPPDVDVVRAVLAPYGSVPGEPTTDRMDFWIRTDDGGEADLSVSSTMVGVERPALGKIRGVIAELADRLGAGVLTPRGTFLFREDSRGHLPEGMENDSVFVPEITGQALGDVETVRPEPGDSFGRERRRGLAHTGRKQERSISGAARIRRRAPGAGAAKLHRADRVGLDPQRYGRHLRRSERPLAAPAELRGHSIR
ncbi:hypothetical protein [Streptomyces sp. NPDC048508]|uniref:hypothetical protein n=1 Tax=Streptomyces sp. NPDC048508 TaxID=3365561 RepID=UPI00371BF564